MLLLLDAFTTDACDGGVPCGNHLFILFEIDVVVEVDEPQAEGLAADEVGSHRVLLGPFLVLGAAELAWEHVAQRLKEPVVLFLVCRGGNPRVGQGDAVQKHPARGTP